MAHSDRIVIIGVVIIAAALVFTVVALSRGGVMHSGTPPTPANIAQDEANAGAADAGAAAAEASAAASAALNENSEAPNGSTSSNWSYSEDTDKVRAATTFYASTTSLNTVYQDPPYDPNTSMKITIRKSPAFGIDVILTISSGQMMCPSYEGCSGTIRFDNGPPQHVRFSGPSDNSSDTIFVEGARPFIGKLEAAKHVVVEKTLYEAGNPQFEFDVSGLKWEH